MIDFFLKLFDTSGFPPRWYCGRWTEGHGWLHIVSDVGIWSAYFAIPLLLLYFIRRRLDVPFRRIFLLFGAFILLCGSTHLMEAVIFWWPAYRLAGVIKLATALVSWGTVLALLPVIPLALALRSPRQLEEEVLRRTEELARANEALRIEVAERRRAEEALRGSEERLRVTLASIGDGVVTTDAQGRAEYLNAVAESLTGWNTADAKGRPLAEVFRIANEETRRVVDNPVDKVLREGATVGLANHTVLIARDGSERPIDDSAAPIRGDGGELLGVVLVFRDVTESKAAERELAANRRLLRTVLDQTPAVIYVKDRSGRLLLVNRPFAELAGRPIEEIVGRTDAEVFGVLDEIRENDRQVFEAGRTFQFEETLDLPDGRRNYLSIKSPVEGIVEDGPVLVGVTADVTEMRQAEAALRESEQRFRTLAETVPEVVWFATPEGSLEYFNSRWQEYTGQSAADGLGEGWAAVIHPDDVGRTVARWTASTETGEPYEIEYRFRSKGGGYRWFLGRAVPVRDEAGNVSRWFGTCTDIDDAKRAEQKAAFLADASAHLSELLDYHSTLQKVADAAVPAFADWIAVDLVGEDGLLRRVATTHADCEKQRVARELAERYPPRQDDPHGPARVVRSGNPELVPDVDESLPATLARDDEHLRLLRELGFRSYVSVPLAAKGRATGVITFVTADSGRRYDASDLALAEDLGRRISVAVENAGLYEALKEADRKKDEFLATLAHELRNPLAPIRMGLEVLRLGGDDPETVGEMLSTMEGQVRQMVRLIDDLLDVSRITRGKLDLRKTRVDVRDVARTALDTVRPLIEEARHELTVSLPDEPLVLDGDPARLSQVFSNLLSNAAKYTPEGGRIEFAAERQGSDLVASVKDTGLGIPPGMLDVVFDMFTQVDRTLERSHGGLGIGLHLVKRLVELHGGRVEARSEGEGKGSQFLVRLPLAVASDGVTDGGPSGGGGTGAGQRVLVADDNKDAADMLARVLKALGHQVRVAYDGQQAIELAESYRPEVCLFDIGMPKMNGYEVARAVRREPWGESMLLVALTGWGAEEDRRRSREAGFDRHLVKPVEPGLLRELLAAGKGS